MTIIDLQRRLAEIGRIRIGQQVATSGGRTRPAKLETFRLTSADRTKVDAAARLFGGKPRQWDAPAGKQWEVITTIDSLDVIVPPSDIAFSQWYEQWSAGGCLRRCDGQYESISDGPCLCDAERRDCDIHTRLSVMLATMPGLGVWRIDTSGYYAAVELNGAVEVIRLAAGRGQMLPARLRLEQRTVKRQDEHGKPVTRRFAVPVLDIDVTPTQLLGGSPMPVRELAPPVDGSAAPPVDGSAAPQLDSPPPLTPVPESVPHRPVGTVAEQMRQLDAEPKPRRSNAQRPVPQTGIAPRTRAEAELFEDQPLPGFQGEQALEEPAPPTAEHSPAEDPPVGSEEEPPPDMVSSAQMKRLQAGFTALGIRNREQRITIIGRIVGRQVESANDLYRAEAATVIDELEERRRILAEEPQAGTAEADR